MNITLPFLLIALALTITLTGLSIQFFGAGIGIATLITLVVAKAVYVFNKVYPANENTPS
jgi:hypothetical protein